MVTWLSSIFLFSFGEKQGSGLGFPPHVSISQTGNAATTCTIMQMSTCMQTYSMYALALVNMFIHLARGSRFPAIKGCSDDSFRSNYTDA